MENGCGRHAGTKSIYCPSHNAVHENMGFAPPTVVDRVLQLHVIATTLVQDFLSLHGHRFCRSYKQMQKFKCSSAVAQNAEFIQFAFDDVDQMFSGCPNTWNGWYCKHFTRSTHTKYWSPRLHWPYSIRSWVESVLLTSFLVSQKASSTQGCTFRPMCCLSYANVDIDLGETLIFAILPSVTVPCSSLCMIILYGGSPLSSSRINQSQAICMALC